MTRSGLHGLKTKRALPMRSVGSRHAAGERSKSFRATCARSTSLAPIEHDRQHDSRSAAKRSRLARRQTLSRGDSGDTADAAKVRSARARLALTPHAACEFDRCCARLDRPADTGNASSDALRSPLLLLRRCAALAHSRRCTPTRANARLVSLRPRTGHCDLQPCLGSL